MPTERTKPLQVGRRQPGSDPFVQFGEGDIMLAEFGQDGGSDEVELPLRNAHPLAAGDVRRAAGDPFLRVQFSHLFLLR